MKPHNPTKKLVILTAVLLPVLSLLFGALGISPASAATPQLVATTTVGSDPYAVSSDGTHVWVANYGDNTVSEIDVATGLVVRTINDPSFDNPFAISSDGTHVWVANYVSGTVTEIDASPGQADNPGGTPITVGSEPSGISSDGTHVWVANYGDNTVSEINAATGAVVQLINDASFHSPWGISSDGTHVWVTNYTGDTVTQLNAATGQVDNPGGNPIPVGNGPDAISSDGTHVWVANYSSDTVTEIDAATGQVDNPGGSPIPVGTGPSGISSDGTHVWVANFTNNSVTEIDGATGAAVTTINDASLAEAYGISSDGAHLWVTSIQNGTVSEYAVPSPPGPPTLVAGSPGNGQVHLTWTAPSVDGGSAITGYTVQYSADGGSTWVTDTACTGTATNCTVTGLTNGSTYVFRVSATNGIGTGSYSVPSSPVALTPVTPATPAKLAATGTNLETLLALGSILVLSGAIGVKWPRKRRLISLQKT